MKKISHENNFLYLCIALVALLFSASIVKEFSNSWGEKFFSLMYILMLTLSIKSMKTEITWKGIVYVLIGLQIIFALISNFFIFAAVPYIILSILLFFFVGSFWSAYKQILFEGNIDSNKIIGSISLYLLLGLIWTTIYLLLLQFDAYAFVGVEATSWQHNFSRMAYYSFVTLTTLGYGDILPKNPLAQFFVYMEAIIGVFYVAVIVASLISLRLTEIEKKD